jgi:hypothetical protein
MFYRKRLLAPCLTTTLVDWVLYEFTLHWCLRIYVSPEAGWPGYTPRHWIPVLVAFFDTHRVHWGYSESRPPFGKRVRSDVLNAIKYTELKTIWKLLS